MARRPPKVSPPPEQIRCAECRRYRLKGHVCDHCDLQQPGRCTCDVLPLDTSEAVIPDSHRHMLHALLELIYKRAVEETDEWILQPASDIQPRPRPHWSENPELTPLLAEHPILVALCRRNVEAVYDWAGVRPREAEAFDMHVIGWRDEVIAAKLEAGVPEVQQLYDRALVRIRTTLALVEGQIAS